MVTWMHEATEGKKPIGADGLLHIIRPGEVPIDVEGPDGQPITLVQVYDEKALASIMNAFAEEAKSAGWGGMLIDRDHFSEDTDKPSEAMGWATEFVLRDDGIFARPDWSDLGEQAVVKGKRYKYASVSHRPSDCEFLGNNRVRPLRVKRIAVTNDPRSKGLLPYAAQFKNRALLNRLQTGDFADSKSASVPGASGQDDGGIRMKSVMKALGLVEDADESAALAAITTLNNRIGTLGAADQELKTIKAERDALKNRVAELERADLARQVEADLDQHKGKYADRDAAKAMLLKNRDATLAAWAAMPTSKLLSREDAKRPAGAATESKETEADRARAVKIRNRATELRKTNAKLGHAEAFRLAAAEMDG